MDLEDEFFDNIIYVDKGFSESESDEKSKEQAESSKENIKKITRVQCKKLFSSMDGRPGFPKGKMKSNEETEKLLKDWEQLSSELNAMGPPQHSVSKWRRIWTKMKSKKKKETFAFISSSVSERQQKR